MGTFYTDTIQYDKRFNSTERISDILLLEPVTRKIVQSIIEQAKLNGLELMVFETYRSQDRQALLYERGATKLQKVGVHHYGLACDIVRSINGEPSWKGDFSLLGQLAWHNKVIWGGNWGTPAIKHTFIDDDHIQRCTIGRQAALFSGQWYPDEKYDPYQDLKN